MFEAIVALWTIIMILLAGGSHGAKLGEKKALPNPPKTTELIANAPNSVTPSTSLKTTTPIPTPALLPGIVVFLGSVLRKRKTHSQNADSAPKV